MYFSRLMPVTLFMSTLKTSLCSDSCSWYEAVVKKDLKMKGHVFRHIKLLSVYDCEAKCVMSSACQSFNFDLNERMCQLNSNSSELVDVMPGVRFLFSDIQHWPKGVAGPCSTVMCAMRETCDVDRLGHATCSQEFQGCGAPPDVPNSKVNYEGHFLQAEADYKCDTDFRPCGQSQTLTCNITWTWKGASFTCERFR